MQKKESSTLNYYDGISRGYSELYWEEQRAKIGLIDKFLLNVDESARVLDLGSGDGVLNSFLKCKFVSFDLSYELLKLNSNNLKVCGSVLNLPFKDGSFDCICSFTCIQDVVDVDRAFSEIVRVLDIDGKFIVSFLKMSSQKDLILENIDKYFDVKFETEEVKDLIFVLEKRE